MILHKLLLGINALLGYLYKVLIDLHILKVPNICKDNSADILVSLTSYGRRVSTNVVYYTLVSLLRQTIQPSHIVLWLAEDEWNDEIIPKKLKKLKENGVEICYCRDIKSYKKLIPSLNKYPNTTIITVDDDMIYSKDTISTFMLVHNNYPKDVICMTARRPILIEGIPSKYREWVEYSNQSEGMYIFPVGVGGVLYPIDALHNDVKKEELFMKLCPNADDIWFWFCGLRNNVKKRFVTKKEKDLSYDSLYQFFHKGSALTHTNNFKHQNDEQLRNLFDYFNYRIECVTDK